MTIRDLLTHLGIEFKEHGEDHHVTRGWVGISCNHCKSDSFKLGINTRSLRATCWTCGPQPLAWSLAEISGQSRKYVASLLAELGEHPGAIGDNLEVVGRYKEPSGVGPLLPEHRNYLAGRGFDPDEVAEKWGVKGIGRGGRYQWRLFVPIFVEKKPVSWTTRAVGNVELRYVSAPKTEESVHLKDTLFGEDYVRNTIVVTEGVFDAMRIGPGACATYGLSITRSQVARIARYPVRVICLDNEPEAQRVARRLAADLAPFPGATYTVTLSGPDPCDSPAEELEELRRRFLT